NSLLSDRRAGIAAEVPRRSGHPPEPIRDHLGLPLLPDPPTLLRTPPRLLSNRGVGRIGVRPIAAVAPVAATACRAGRCSARCPMAPYWSCASSQFAFLHLQI